MANFIANTLTSIFGGKKSERDVKSMQPLVEKINAQYQQLSALSNDELRNKTKIFRSIINEKLSDIQNEIDTLKQQADDANLSLAEKESHYDRIDKLIEQKDEQLEAILNELLPEAFAVVKETARRFKENDELRSKASELDRQLAATRDHIIIDNDEVIYKTSWLAAGSMVKWDMVHYDVQLIGGIVLHQGKIAEMATGEGKTLVATLPCYLNGLAAEGVHLVTVNDYLARRDSEWMGPILQFLGLTVDCIDNSQPHSPERKAAYLADVTYGTNNEFGFDYLRDNMAHAPEDRVLRKFHYAMVDEVDSVLIDDARTPLIISGPVPKGDQQEFRNLKPRIEKLVEAQKKVVSKNLLEAKKTLNSSKHLEKEGGLALLRAFRGLPKNKAIIKYLSEEGVKQKLLKTESYYLRDQEKEMPLVDEELYFTIDEKNNQVEMTDKGLDLITLEGEDKDFFVMPDVGSIIAEIEKSDLSDEEKQRKKDEAFTDFAIKSERVHSIVQLLKAYALFEKDIEYVVMDGQVKIVDEQTGRIMEGRRYSDGLHQAIEAKENVKVEAATQTFATVTLQNFFRMYHKLAGMTGTAETEAGEFWEIYELDVVVIPTNLPIIRDDKDDLVYRTKREKYNAVIDEIERLKKAGRPVLVGTTSVEVSELLSRMLKIKGIPHNVLNAKQHQSEAQIVQEAGQPGQVTIATNMAGRGTDIKINKEVIAAGGLAIVGTEKHEARRIDRQLRGRAGRQGDPGSSQFYVSLEDDLMRLFGSERIAKIMDRMGYKEGDVIQHSMITKSIERAQKKIEENNFGIRKRLIDYDDVMNSQREMVYKRRSHALLGERLSVDIQNTFYELAESIITESHQSQDFELLKLNALRYFSLELPFSEDEFLKSDAIDLIDKLYDKAASLYKRKSEAIKQMAMPVLEDVYRTRKETVEYVAVPFTDGKKVVNTRTNLEKVMNTGGDELIRSFEKTVVLGMIDEAWKDHLRQMDELKQSVQAAVYEQKDPLLIFKFEAFELFKNMLYELNRDIASFLFKGNIPLQQGSQVQQAGSRERNRDEGLQTSRRDTFGDQNRQIAGNAGEPKKQKPVHVEKVGRNDPCPCGSGKKYKKCHGAPNRINA